MGAGRAADNLLIRGDALHTLTSLAKLPEFAREYLGKVKLAYLDPPFNTQQSFLNYDDALEHSVWLTMMRDRCLQHPGRGRIDVGSGRVTCLDPPAGRHLNGVRSPDATPSPHPRSRTLTQVAVDLALIIAA